MCLCAFVNYVNLWFYKKLHFVLLIAHSLPLLTAVVVASALKFLCVLLIFFLIFLIFCRFNLAKTRWKRGGDERWPVKWSAVEQCAISNITTTIIALRGAHVLAVSPMNAYKFTYIFLHLHIHMPPNIRAYVYVYVLYGCMSVCRQVEVKNLACISALQVVAAAA